MKTIAEWADYHEETTEPGYFPEVAELISNVRAEAFAAAIEAINGLLNRYTLVGFAYDRAINAIEQLAKED